MAINKDIPQPGEVWFFAPKDGSKSGHEQDGYRPHLVISVTDKNRLTKSVTCVPITSTNKPYPTRVPVPDGTKVSDDFTLTGFIETEFVNSYDFSARKAKYACTLPTDTVAKVHMLVGLSLGFSAS